jgi:hypothetical protein
MNFAEEMLSIQDQKTVKEIFDEARRYFPLIEFYKKQDIMEDGSGWAGSASPLVESFGVSSNSPAPSAYHSKELSSLLCRFFDNKASSLLTQGNTFLPPGFKELKIVVTVTRFDNSKNDYEFLAEDLVPPSILTFLVLNGPGLEDRGGRPRRVTLDSAHVLRGAFHPEPETPFRIRNHSNWDFLFVLAIHITSV